MQAFTMTQIINYLQTRCIKFALHKLFRFWKRKRKKKQEMIIVKIMKYFPTRTAYFHLASSLFM